LKQFYFLFPLIITLIFVTAVQSQSMDQTGSLTLNISGYEIPGQLANATISNNIATMIMDIDYTANTSLGQVPITASGNWYGTVNGTSLSGVIYNVKGTVRVCYLLYCANANYVGYGVWSGTLSSQGDRGNGTFQGIITVTSSGLPNVTLNKPIPISGTWNSTFQHTS